MNSQDKFIRAGIAIIILVPLAIWIIGYATDK